MTVSLQIDLQDYWGTVSSLTSEVRCSVSWIDKDDLFQEGMLALWEVLPTYDASYETSVFQFVVPRIKWAMQEHVRQHHPCTRFLLMCQKEMNRLRTWYSALFGHPPPQDHLYSYLDTTPRRYERLRLRLCTSQPALANDDYVGEAGDTASLWNTTPLDPASFIERRDLSEKLARAVTQLPERKQIVVALVLYSGLTQYAIGKELGISEGRVSQIVKSSVPLLAQHLRW